MATSTDQPGPTKKRKGNLYEIHLREKVSDALYLNEKMSDVNFLFYEKKSNRRNVRKLIEKVPAHKLILASASLVFHAEFFGSIKEKGDVEIVDSSPGAFKEFLQCFYLGTITFTMENIPEVMYLANKYMVAECMDACTKYLTDNLTTTNVCWVYELAILHERQQLKQICDEHITSNAETLLKSDEFLSCSQKSLREILKMDLHCKESIVFDRCLAWAKNACQQNGLDENDGSNLRNQLGKCLFLIRFGTMRIQEFSEATLKCKGMFTADELCDVMGSITLNGFFSKKFNQVPRRFWDESKVWRCKPKPLKRVAFQIQFLESVFFTSNKMTLLGGIYIPNVWGERSFSAKATVVEIKGHSFATEAGTILFEEDKNFVCNAEGYVKLPTPIIINPSNTYEICLEVTSTTVNLLTSKWDLGEVPSMNGLIIKFKHIYLNSVHMSFGLELIDF